MALLWKEEINLNIIYFSLNQISGSVSKEEEDQLWFFSGIYGFPEENLKRDTWELVRILKRESEEKWLCVFDFNDVLEAGIR